MRSCHHDSRGVTPGSPAGGAGEAAPRGSPGGTGPIAGRAPSLSGWDDIVDTVVGMETPLPTALGDKTARPLRPPARAAHGGRPAAPLSPALHRAHPGHPLLRPRGPAVPRQRARHAARHGAQRHRAADAPPQGPHRRGHVAIGAQRLTCTFFNQPYRERDLQPGTRAAVLRRPQPLPGRLAARPPPSSSSSARAPAPTCRGYPRLPGHQEAALLGGDDGRAPGARPARRPRGPAARRRCAPPTGSPRWPTPCGACTCPTPGPSRSAARRRLVWDEAFGLQLAMAGPARERHHPPGAACPRREDGLAAAFDARLPFALTGAQTTVGESLADALARPRAAQPAAAGRRRLGQDDRGAAGDAPGRRRRTAGGAARADRGPGRPARPLAAGDARAAGPGGRARCRPGRARTRVTLLTGSLGAKARREALLDAQSGGRASSSAPTR